MAQRGQASSTTRTCAMCSRSRATAAIAALLALAGLAQAPLAGAMYLPIGPSATADPAAAGAVVTAGKCVDSLASARVPEAQAMMMSVEPGVPAPTTTSTISTTTTTTSAPDTTEAPPAASTTEEPSDAATTLAPEPMYADSGTPPTGSGVSAASVLDEALREQERSIAQQRQAVEDSLSELFTRASSRMGRYASGFPQLQARSLFGRRMSLPPPYEVPPEVSKDVYIHLAADETVPTMATPPPLPPRKHYKIIVIKPPTPAPPVETTTRRVDVETLIYVLVPKGEAPSPPPTTPRAPSKHEVFFIRYKAPAENKTASLGGAEAELAVTPTYASTSTTVKPPAEVSDYLNLVDLRSSSSEIRARAALDEDSDENELDGTVRDSDAINDLLSVSTDDIVRSWRRADGDIHFDADLKRIARSHNSHAEATDADEETAEAEAVPGTGGPPPAVRCRQYATAEDLNAALDAEDEDGKRVAGAPDFDAVLQGKVHYGRRAEVAEICAEKSASEPFAIRDVSPPAPPAEMEPFENDSVEDRKVEVVRKPKFSARYASSLMF